MLLVATLAANYSRIEARFSHENLLECSARRALNLTEDWLLSVITEEDWNNHYKDILSANFEEAERLEEQYDRWGEPDEEGRGEFVLVREDAPTSNFNFKPANKD